MKEKLLRIVLLVGIFVGFITPVCAHAETAKLVDFPVTINGVSMTDVMGQTQYPLLVYKDITYVPMTYYHCRMLGLETTWSEKNGLAIQQNNAVTSSISYYATNKENPKQVTVSIPKFSVTVNGENIYNNKEEYPLLVFRDVTYFPLTWRFAHDAFGWIYDYTLENGLQIKSNNPQVVYFSTLPWRISSTPITMLDHGCYYYLENEWNEGEITAVRAPIDNSYRKQVVYTFTEQPEEIQFILLDDKPYLLYRTTKADDVQILQILEDGTSKEVTLNLDDYVNGKSDGDKQDGWQYKLQDGKLCRSQDGITWTQYSEHTANWYGLLNGNVFYLHESAEGKQYLYQATGSMQDKRLTSDAVTDVSLQDGYLVCKMEHGGNYGVCIYSGAGELVLAVANHATQVSIGANTVLITTSEQENSWESMKIVKLF